MDVPLAAVDPKANISLMVDEVLFSAKTSPSLSM
jgi:hypothetical protein